MKYNLTNRPKPYEKHEVYDPYLEEWFEGFEAELRDKLRDYSHDRYNLIMEILGE